jgi:hypothetical protein
MASCGIPGEDPIVVGEIASGGAACDSAASVCVVEEESRVGCGER